MNISRWHGFFVSVKQRTSAKKRCYEVVLAELTILRIRLFICMLYRITILHPEKRQMIMVLS